MSLDEYLQSLKGKSVSVIGLGVSNTPLVRLLLAAGVSVTVRDKRTGEELGDIFDELEAGGARFILGEGYLENITEEVIFRTPGLLPDVPELRAARERGSRVTSEMEAFFELCPCRVIAVTGSDGKTTTTTIISEILKAGGYTVHIGGNIGTPLLDRVPEMRPDDIAVLELSSFQLHSMRCAPDVAVITNLAPNHLDKHTSMQDYSDAKKMAFKNQRADGVLVLNAACALLDDFSDEAPGEVRYFNTPDAKSCAYLTNNKVMMRHNNKEAEIMSTNDIKIPGSHNVENYMAAILATLDFVEPELYKKVAMEFSGVRHRLELIREIGSVQYINDSIASSPTRTAAGLHAIPAKPLLIAGGSDKGIPFDELGSEICRNVKALYLLGTTANKIREAVMSAPEYNGELPIHMVQSLDEAVWAAHDAAVEGDIVLLSPACASFDMFKNFEDRGDRFRDIVLELE